MITRTRFLILGELAMNGMRCFAQFGVILSVVTGCLATPVFAGSLKAPNALTAEYLRNPVGLDCASPRLSWKLEAVDADGRDLRQTAYQVLVASTQKKLDRDESDLWDSGRVESPQSLNIAYSGAPLASSQRCHWRVRVWDNASSEPSAWSQPARWVMGIVRPKDWRAEWIGANALTRPPFDLRGAQWISSDGSFGRTRRKFFTSTTPVNVATPPSSYTSMHNGIRWRL